MWQNGITKCVRLVDYKVWQQWITKCVRYYNVCQNGLQSALGITKCVWYYNVCQNGLQSALGITKCQGGLQSA